MMPARLAPSVCQEKRASSGPCCRSLGHTRNTYGLIPDRSGLDADGEIIGVGVAPPPYTRAAEREGPELRCPTTATIAGSAYNCSATRTAVSSFGIDLVDRQLGGPEHRGSTRLGEGAREADGNRPRWAGAGRYRDDGAEEK